MRDQSERGEELRKRHALISDGHPDLEPIEDATCPQDPGEFQQPQQSYSLYGLHLLELRGAVGETGRIKGHDRNKIDSAPGPQVVSDDASMVALLKAAVHRLIRIHQEELEDEVYEKYPVNEGIDDEQGIQTCLHHPNLNRGDNRYEDHRNKRYHVPMPQEPAILWIYQPPRNVLATSRRLNGKVFELLYPSASEISERLL
mmetsp:Transcript_26079/g.72922  ORF Transcript_26079/g.72922 Transcript_26079/m.72922 type:complete len:201 (-) Transcript_26079:452-1054(-)